MWVFFHILWHICYYSILACFDTILYRTIICVLSKQSSLNQFGCYTAGTYMAHTLLKAWGSDLQLLDCGCYIIFSTAHREYRSTTYVNTHELESWPRDITFCSCWNNQQCLSFHYMPCQIKALGPEIFVVKSSQHFDRTIAGCLDYCYINSHLLYFISSSEMHPIYRELSISYLLVCVQEMPRTHLKHYCYDLWGTLWHNLCLCRI